MNRKFPGGDAFLSVRLLCDVVLGCAELPFQQLHLIFQPEFEFFEPDFLELFVFGEESFLGEVIEALRVLCVFHSQPFESIITRQK
jgi:hypothetical protein